jgi:hypothetical protein
MRVQNQSRDEYDDQAGVDTVPAQRPAPDDARISWQREPGDGDEPTVGDEPGDGDEPTVGDEPVAASDQPAVTPLWSDGDGQRFRDRWREVQLRFVDDPRAATQEAEALVGEAIDGVSAALAAQRDRLAGWRSADSDDTEELRTAVRRYREVLDRVLAL